jgi:membrane protein
MSWKEFFTHLKNEYTRDNLSNVAGSVTYFGLLAIFPFLLCLVALSSLVIDPKQANELITQLGKVAPPAATELLGGQLQSLASKESGGLFTFALLGALWAASGGMIALMNALNIVYDVEEGRNFFKQRLIAIGMVLFTAVFALGAALLAVATPAIAELLPSPLGTVLTWLRLPIAGLLMMFLWAVLYYVLPDVQQKFKFITPGSVVGVIVWVLASYGFSVYVTNFGKYDATYGALGGVVVMLLWMWISAQVLLAGAEINAILEHKSADGKKVGAKSLKDSGPSPTKTEIEGTDQRATGNGAPRPAQPAMARRAVRVERGSPHNHAAKPTLLWLGLAMLVGKLRGRREI